MHHPLRLEKKRIPATPGGAILKLAEPPSGAAVSNLCEVL